MSGGKHDAAIRLLHSEIYQAQGRLESAIQHRDEHYQRYRNSSEYEQQCRDQLRAEYRS